jgi:type IV pilus assembly protein PilQ
MALRICALVVLLAVVDVASATEPFGPALPDTIEVVPDVRLLDTTVVLPVVEFRDTPLKEALEALARPYGVDLWVDPSVTGSVSMRLTNVTLDSALLFLITNNKLSFSRDQGIIRIFPKPPEPPPSPHIEYAGGKLSVDAEQIDVQVLARLITEQTGQNLIAEEGASGLLSIHIRNVEFEAGLRAVLEAHGLALNKWEGIYRIARPAAVAGGGRPASVATRCENGKVSIAVANADLYPLIEQIASACGLQLFVYGTIDGKVSAVCNNLDPEDVFAYILNGTQYTYKQEDGVYFVGDKKIDEINTSQFVPFHHVVAKDLIELVPEKLSALVSIKAASEQNGLLISGPYGAVREVARYLQPLDTPPAQILIEALVVDYSTTETSEFSLTAFNKAPGDTSRVYDRYFPDLAFERSGPEMQKGVDEWASHLGIANIGRLPENFYVRLRALEQKGIANIRSRPEIAALNGHKASIHVGTTQYYLLKTETVYASGQPAVSTQVSQHFETINADIAFEVTPWVTSTGEIIVDIKPEFTTPQGVFDPNIPPTINRRILESTVRLKDGETIVLGGLIQSGKTHSIDKFPLLGDIPILGRIFQNRHTIDTKNELVIYLTPKVYYGSEGSIDPNTIKKQ